MLRGTPWPDGFSSLNEVRPGRPEQYRCALTRRIVKVWVSMKSGLEGRNNHTSLSKTPKVTGVSMKSGLEGRNNFLSVMSHGMLSISLNEVRPGRPEQWLTAPQSALAPACLNEVRPGRPEQSDELDEQEDPAISVSMKSGLEGRNNLMYPGIPLTPGYVSMKSGLEGRNNWRWRLVGFVRHACLNEVRPGRPEQSRLQPGAGRAGHRSQ